jgi:Tfp pilus assembly protein PilF
MEKGKKGKKNQPKNSELMDSIKGKSADDLIEMAQDHETKFEMDEANVCFQEALNLASNEPKIMDLYAEFLIGQEDYDKAMKLL